jgi:hypothetical protein
MSKLGGLIFDVELILAEPAVSPRQMAGKVVTFILDSIQEDYDIDLSDYEEEE